MGDFQQQPTVPGVFSDQASRLATVETAARGISVLQEAIPHVEQAPYATLADGDDWTAAFNAVRDHVGIGGSFGVGARTYELNSFAPLRQQQIVGEGSSRTILKAKSGATRVLDMVGQTRYPMLKGVKIDGRSKASEGTRLQALNGTGGETNQAACYEDVQWWDCTIAHRVAGTGGVPQAGQADKIRYRDCAMFQFNVGLQVDIINGQQQVWDGGEISEGTLCVKLFGGGFIGIGMQFQQSTSGTGKIMEFAGANIETVALYACLSEGWLTGFDSTGSNLWPLQPVIIDGGTHQVHEAAGGDLFIVDRGGTPVGLVARGAAFNGGPIRLRGNDTYFRDTNCKYNLTGGTAATVVRAGTNCFYLPEIEAWHEIGAASEPAFTNSWVNFGAGNATAAYKVTPDGFVHLKGTIKSGVIGSAAFTLPAGFRPALYSRFGTVSNGAFGAIEVSNAGVVLPSIGNNTYISLEGVKFASTVAAT